MGIIEKIEHYSLELRSYLSLKLIALFLLLLDTDYADDEEATFSMAAPYLESQHVSDEVFRVKDIWN